MCSAFLLGCVLVRAGARPYLGARIVSGDEMIDGVLFPREVAAARSMEAGQRGGVGGGSIAGAGRKGIGLMMGERAVITSGGGVDELRCCRVGWGECVVAEFAEDVVGAPAEFAGDREAGAVVVDSFGDVAVVGVVG